ncbi:ribosomal RNA small subunit methyltransferase, mitochondrial [Coffea arabica]|uniref:rRNA adenine N(6)-methyltransferase n=1 Tax=Coffea arabica TaxID=13443 RepID=A0A6P6T793_COFAR|nr:ribosomal RNA small subunit methyltransferase, mitochondrial-like [Coffea arabica]
MLHRCKSLPSKFSAAIIRRSFLIQQIRSKSSRRFNIRDSDKEDDEDDYDNNLGSDVKVSEKHLQLFKSRGQHLLTNPRVLDTIVRKSNIKPNDTVLEIGPGTGNLTLKLLEVAEKVNAIEIDKRMVEILHKKVAERGFEDRLTVIRDDALKVDFPQFDLVVANIPYGISSRLVAKFVFGGSKFRSATLLLQKEFARRLLADPGEPEYNRLAANVKLVADVEFVMDVSKRDFLPVPKIDSSVIKIWPKEDVPSVDLMEWWAFTRMCFSKKNKTLGAIFKKKRKLMELMKLSQTDGSFHGDDEKEVELNAESEDEHEDDKNEMETNLAMGYKKGMSSFKEKVVEIIRSGGVESKRPSKLSNEELLHLLSVFNQAGIHFHDQAEVKDANNAKYYDKLITTFIKYELTPN